MFIELEKVLSEPKYRIKVQDLPFGPSTKIALRNYDIVYVAELIQLSENDIICTPNLGRKNLAEIKEILRDLGLELGSTIEGYPENKELRAAFGYDPEEKKLRPQSFASWYLTGIPESTFHPRKVTAITVAGKILVDNRKNGCRAQIDLDEPLEINIGTPPKGETIPYVVGPDMSSVSDGLKGYKPFLAARLYAYEGLRDGTIVQIEDITMYRFADGGRALTSNLSKINLCMRRFHGQPRAHPIAARKSALG